MRKSFITFAVVAALGLAATAANAGGCYNRKGQKIGYVGGSNVAAFDASTRDCIQKGGSWAGLRGSFSSPSLAFDGPFKAIAIKAFKRDGCDGQMHACKR
ncbi:MAG: hypothetical protein GC129_02320 [Proteobacteria bacterium]|nr:hypothetical protein [Pseudomonadota bacterium]